MDARRARILDAALEVLASEGISEATTRKIAAKADVNQAMLRYYFGSKDDLLLAVLQEMMRITREIVQQAIVGNRGLRETILGGLLSFWKHVEARPDLQIMQYELTLYALRSPASAWLAKEQYEGYCTVVEMLLEEGFAAAGKTSALALPELARFVVSGMDGLILQFVSNRNTTQARLGLAHLVDAVLALSERRNTGEARAGQN